MYWEARSAKRKKKARLYNSYKNTKLTFLKINAAVWFNNMCKIEHLKPNYINIKINGKKLQDKKTTTNAINYRINQEINSLSCKKQNLNRYIICIKNAHTLVMVCGSISKIHLIDD